LDALADGMQQSADVSGVVGHTKRPSHHIGHALARPDLPAEAVCLSPWLQELGNLRELHGGEPWLSTRSGMASQPLDALLASPFELLAHGSRRHPQRDGDIVLLPALLFQLPGPLSPPFTPVELRRFRARAFSVASL
jgi:hypothetical protein